MNLSTSGVLFILCLVHLVGILLFVYGFFPNNIQLLKGISKSGERSWLGGVKELLRDDICYSKIESKFTGDALKKTIILVIDAWQAQFYINRHERMPFLASLHASSIATVFDAHVQSPTVTMPRIKAFTAGVVPSFADVVFNFASSEIAEDNIVDQLKSAGHRILFCGDDTWLRLFPGRFEDGSEGIVSFYVNDYTEVDNNVTRCADRAFNFVSIANWDIMILHYLGLDHIGHSLGGTHEKIDVKLREMDHIIEKLYYNLKSHYGDNFCIVALGDHGMTDAGGHGGSSSSETHVPLVFINGKAKPGNKSSVFNEIVKKVEQVDLVPTLAFLHRVAFPQNSLGVVLTDDVIEVSSSVYETSVLLSVILNFHQFASLSKSAGENHSGCLEEAISYLRNFCHTNVRSYSKLDGVVKICKDSLRTLQRDLLLKQTDVALLLCVAGLLVSFLLTVFSFLNYCIVLSMENDVLASEPVSRRRNISQPHVYNFSIKLTHVLLSLQIVTFFSSSLIEEEHDLQYFSFATILFGVLFYSLYIAVLKDLRAYGKNILVYHKSNRFKASLSPDLFSIVCLLFLHRISRAFTEGTRRRWLLKDVVKGDPDGASNWVFVSASLGSLYSAITSIDSEPAMDIGSFLIYNATTGVWVSVVVGILVASLCCSLILKREKISYFNSLFSLIFGFCVVILKQTKAFGSSEHLLWWFMIVIVVMLVTVFREPWFGLLLWIAFLYRNNLFALLALDYLAGICLAQLNDEPLLPYLAISSSFFYLGNSNGLSTIDVSAGYTGIQSYQPVIIAFQIFLSTYSGPICTLISWWENRTKTPVIRNFQKLKFFAIFAVFARITTCILTLLIQRNHLFIWSVFAPKFLYEVAHFVFFVLILLSTFFSSNRSHTSTT